MASEPKRRVATSKEGGGANKIIWCAPGGAKCCNFLIAYSGGLDSHVLLHLMTQIREDNPKIKLTAIHINHGLSPNADKWEQHCCQVCRALKIPLLVKKVSVSNLSKKGLEAEARQLRYETFTAALTKNQWLLTAHNQNDQAETLLLQLFRGTGPKGLAAMPAIIEFANGFLARPLLKYSRTELQAYAENNQLKWIEDESNLNLGFDRNFIRHKLLPIIEERWPAAQQTLSRTAKHCAEASELLDEIAKNDLSFIRHCEDKVRSNPEDLKIKKTGLLRYARNDALFISVLLKFSPARQRNILREWLRQLNFPAPSDVKISQIQNEVVMAAADAQPLVTWEGTEIRRYQNYLYALKPAVAPLIFDWKILPQKKGRGYLKLPQKAKVSVRFRQAGERCQPVGRVGSHPLKKLMQEWQIPPWERDRVPLIYYDNKLVAVVGYCICQGWETKGKELGLEING